MQLLLMFVMAIALIVFIDTISEIALDRVKNETKKKKKKKI